MCFKKTGLNLRTDEREEVDARLFLNQDPEVESSSFLSLSSPSLPLQLSRLPPHLPRRCCLTSSTPRPTSPPPASRSSSSASLFFFFFLPSAGSVVFYPEPFTPLSQIPTHQRQTQSHKYIYKYCICINEYKNGQTSEMQKLAHTHLQTLRMRRRTCVCVSSRHWCSFKKKKSRTSLPRELSAIADLNLHRYISALRAASELLWLPLQKQVHFFVFSGTKKTSGGLSRAPLGTIWMHIHRRVFTGKRDTRWESMSTQSYLRIIRTEQRGGPGVYMIIATVNDYFLFLLFLVSGVVGWKKKKYSAETLFFFFSFSPFFFFHYKYINI